MTKNWLSDLIDETIAAAVEGLAGAYTNAEVLSKVRPAWEAEPDLARVELTPSRMGKALGRLGFRRFKTHVTPDKSERGWLF